MPDVRPIELEELTPVGHDLARPECVLLTATGWIYASDGRGGIMTISPGGAQRLIETPGLRPNGIALLADRSFLIANLEGDGGVWRVTDADRRPVVSPYLLEIDGAPLASVNFVYLDHLGRVWISVSSPDAAAGNYRRDVADGYIALATETGARIVADGLHWTNELRISDDGRTLFVNETFGRRVTAFDVAGDGALRGRRTVTQFGAGVFPDGLALDVEGGLWVTSVISNQLFRVSPDGTQRLVLADPDPRLEAYEALFQSNRLSRGELANASGRRLKNISSVNFGGADRRTIVLGSLGGASVESFTSPIAGQAPAHWLW